MILQILKWLIGAIVVILILLWLIDGGLSRVGTTFNEFSFQSPWSWAASTTKSLDGFVTGQGIITLPSVQGVGPATTTEETTVQQAPPPPPTPTPEPAEERLQQLQAQYQNLKAQAQYQGAVQ